MQIDKLRKDSVKSVGETKKIFSLSDSDLEGIVGGANRTECQWFCYVNGSFECVYYCFPAG